MIIFESIRTVAKTDLSVLILGPTGLGQGSRRPDHPRTQQPAARDLPGRQLRGPARHAVRVGGVRLRARRVHRRLRAQAGPRSSSPTTARCSSTRSATCRRWRRRSCCASSRSTASSASAAARASRSTSGSSARPTARSNRSSPTARSAKTSTTASTPSRSGCRRCASGPVDIPVLADRFLARYCAAQGLPLDARQFAPDAARPADGLPVARQHPRTRDHRVARGAVGAATASSTRRTSSSCTRPPHGAARPRRRSWCRCATSSATTSAASSTRVDWNKKRAAQVLADQPRNALPQDRRVRPRAGVARMTVSARWHPAGCTTGSWRSCSSLGLAALVDAAAHDADPRPAREPVDPARGPDARHRRRSPSRCRRSTRRCRSPRRSSSSWCSCSAAAPAVVTVALDGADDLADPAAPRTSARSRSTSPSRRSRCGWRRRSTCSLSGVGPLLRLRHAGLATSGLPALALCGVVLPDEQRAERARDGHRVRHVAVRAVAEVLPLGLAELLRRRVDRRAAGRQHARTTDVLERPAGDRAAHPRVATSRSSRRWAASRTRTVHLARSTAST